MRVRTASLPHVVGLMLALAVGLSPAVGAATDYYVQGSSPSCSDGGPGSVGQPWCTIQHAADGMSAGDTVYIRAGVYHEQLVTTVSGSAAGGYITFTAYPGEQPVIDGTGVQTGNNGVVATHDYLKFVGLEIRNWNDNAMWIVGSAHFEVTDCVVHDVGYGVGIASGAHDFVVTRVEAYAFDWYGFDVSPEGTDCYNGTFTDCEAHDANNPTENADGFALGHGGQHDFTLTRCQAYEVGDGFDISADSTTLDRCLAHHCRYQAGIKVWSNNVTLVNCIAYANPGTDLELDRDDLDTPDTTRAYNCTFFDAGDSTIWVESAADRLEMYNCILAGGDNKGLTFEAVQGGGAPNYQGDYNVFHNDDPQRTIVVAYDPELSSSQVAAGVWTSLGGQDAHSLVVDAATDLFVDPTSYDLHLLATSVAVDGGTGTGAPSVDYDGNTRPQGAGYDIGAYELTAGGGCQVSCTATVPSTAGVGASVSFHATATTSGCSGGSTVQWSFGDGASATTTDASHSYTTAGSYQWSLTVTAAGVQCQKSGTITVSAAGAEYEYLIPAVIHGPGTGGTQWRTSVAALNVGGSSATVTVSLVTDGSPLQATTTLAGLASSEWADVVVGLLGASASASTSGALHVAADHPLLLTSRTFNQGGGGTYGQYLPALTAANSLTSGDDGYLLQLKGGASFRTNVGYANLGNTSCTVRLRLYDANGAAVGSPVNTTVAAGHWRQVNDVFAAAGGGSRPLAWATVELQSGEGPFWAYASVVDNTTGDATTIPVLTP